MGIFLHGNQRPEGVHSPPAGQQHQYTVVIPIHTNTVSYVLYIYSVLATSAAEKLRIIVSRFGCTQTPPPLPKVGLVQGWFLWRGILGGEINLGLGNICTSHPLLSIEHSASIYL